MRIHPNKLISGYVDDEVSPRQRSRVERHLRACAECRAQLDSLRSLKDAVAAAKPSQSMDATPEFFWTQVRRRIEQEGSTPGREALPTTEGFDVTWWRRVAMAAAAVVVLAGTAVLLLQFPGAPQAPATFVTVESATTSVPNARVEIVQSAATGVTVIDVPQLYVEVEKVSTQVPNATVSTFQSDETGMTVIWISGLENGMNGEDSEPM
jgi:anti-sigma factor RsiW